MAEKSEHALSLISRGDLTVSGVQKVESFDDREVVVVTTMGMLTVRGMALHIRHLDLENGDLRLDGQVESILYSDKVERRRNLMQRLVR